MLEERCLHGMEKTTCGFCNSTHFPIDRRKNRIRPYLETIYVERRKQLRDTRELWGVEEFILLYCSFNGVSNLKKGNGRTKLLQTCLTLGRTKMAVIWQYKHMFIERSWERCHNMFEAVEAITK